MIRTSARSSLVALTVTTALCVAATPVRAQENVTAPAHSLHAAIAREATRLAHASVRSTPRQEPVPQQRSWVGRHPIATGALIGAAAGATYGYVMCRGACEGQPQLYMALFGGIGAGIGAGTGAIIGALRH